MSYEAIIFDLDGTAMPSAMEAKPNQATISAVKNNKDKIHLCAATGRSWHRAGDTIKALELTDPCVISGGAQIVDPVKEKILWEVRIDLADIRAIEAAAKGHEYNLAYVTGLKTLENLSFENTSIELPVNIIYLLNVPAPEAEEIIQKLQNNRGIVTAKAYSWKDSEQIDLHITPSSGTKEHAVVELCGMLGVDRKNVAGVGDGHNDIHLFNAVGYKVAMGNAVPELKEAADLVIGSQDDDGLAEFINSVVSTL